MRGLSPGTLIVGIFAILLGLLGAYGVKKMLDKPATVPVKATANAPRLEKVPMAAIDLPAGRTITEDDIMVDGLPEQEAMKLVPYMQSVVQIVGRTLQQPLKKNRVFMPSLFYPKGMGPKLADLLKPGERAVTISLERSAVDSMFVTPGSTVDVLFRSKPDSGASIPDVTVTLLSKVRVVAVGQETLEGVQSKVDDTNSSSTPRTVTLAVNQAQARAMKVVEDRGALSLVLRSDTDAQVADQGGPSTLVGLLGINEPLKPFVTEIYRHGARSVSSFRDGTLEKVTLDPPYGMPVSEPSKEQKQKKIEAWYPGNWGGWGWGWPGYGNGYGDNWGGGIGPHGPF
jgi:Flp pilus assembly protein CpaB